MTIPALVNDPLLIHYLFYISFSLSLSLSLSFYFSLSLSFSLFLSFFSSYLTIPLASFTTPLSICFVFLSVFRSITIFLFLSLSFSISLSSCSCSLCHSYCCHRVFRWCLIPRPRFVSYCLYLPFIPHRNLCHFPLTPITGFSKLDHSTVDSVLLPPNLCV
uniref:Uncharacterized protein n=1 Tax=Anopheles darlingi TaxID=43151 RepID=A0A2M4CX19_ANODA